jgi:hypothetical protein
MSPRYCVDDGESRLCRKCNQWKPRNAAHFAASKKSRFGIRGICRECENHRRKTEKQAQGEELRESRRRRYLAGEKRVEAARVVGRWAKDPFHMRAMMMRRGLQERCKEKGIPWDRELLTTAYIDRWLRCRPSCECCGGEFQLQPKNGQKSDLSPSLDRVDIRFGYVDGNIAMLCWRCNNLKRDATSSELEQIAAWMKTRGV